MGLGFRVKDSGFRNKGLGSRVLRGPHMRGTLN